MGRQKRDLNKVELDEVTATPMRDRGEDAQGRRYWRARTRKDRRTIWAGWGTQSEVAAIVGALVSKGIPSSPSTPAGVRTVADLLQRWQTHQEQRHKGTDIAFGTLRRYKTSVRHWTATVGDVLVNKLDREMIEDQLLAWRASGAMAPRSCRFASVVVAAAYRWGAKRGLCETRDLEKLDGSAVRDDEYVNASETPTRGEFGPVLARIPDGKARDLVCLLALTGARIGELAALRVGDVDLRGGVLTLSGADALRNRRGKSKPRQWPIGADLSQLLAHLTASRPPDEPLIPALPLDCSELVRQALRSACEELDVPRFTSHALRRMVVMELLESGDAKSVSLLTGHSVSTLLRFYVRPRAENLRDLVRRSGAARLVAPPRLQEVRAPGSGTTSKDTDGDT